MKRGVTGLPSYAEKQDIKRWRLCITVMICFICLPGGFALVFLLSGLNITAHEVGGTHLSRPRNLAQKMRIKTTCKSWCERNVSTWNWANDRDKRSLPGRGKWAINFRDTNMLVEKHKAGCCLSTDNMKGYVYGCRWFGIGKEGEIRFNPYMYYMVNETAAVLPYAKRAVVLGMGLGGIPQILVNSWTNLIVDVVEVNKQVVEVAKEAFCFPEEKRIKVILTDVFKWIATVQERKYDAVYIDIFEGKVLPKKAKENHFFRDVSRILKPNGLATSNVLFKDTNYLRNFSVYFKSCTIYKNRYVTCIK